MIQTKDLALGLLMQHKKTLYKIIGLYENDFTVQVEIENEKQTDRSQVRRFSYEDSLLSFNPPTSKMMKLYEKFYPPVSSPKVKP